MSVNACLGNGTLSYDYFDSLFNSPFISLIISLFSYDNQSATQRPDYDTKPSNDLRDRVM